MSIAHPEPNTKSLLQITYADGIWRLGRAEIDENGEVQARTMRPISFDLAQEITQSTGLIAAEVVRSNHIKWLEEWTVKIAEDHARAVDAQEKALEGARQRLDRIKNSREKHVL